MPRYHFPGHPAFLDDAAAEIGWPETASAARRDATLQSVATLCAQAAEGDVRHVSGILVEAEKLVARIRVSLRAAEMMLEHVRVGRQISIPNPTRSQPSPAARRGGRHA